MRPGIPGLPKVLSRAGLIQAALFLAIILTLQALDVRDSRFDEPGPAYLLYNLLRLASLFFLAGIIYGTGRLILGKRLEKLAESSLGAAGPGLVDRFLISSFAGLAGLTLAMYALGFLRLYHPQTALFLGLPGVYLAGRDLGRNFRTLLDRAAGSIQEWSRETGLLVQVLQLLLLAGIVVRLLGLLTAQGLVPGLGDNDIIGSYLPYLAQAREVHHSFWPSQFFINYFHMKGLGLHLLTTLLIDSDSSQLAGLLLYSLTLPLLAATLKRAGVGPGLILAGLFLYLQTPVFPGVFIKIHLAVYCQVIFYFYLTGLIIDWPLPALKRLAPALAILLAGTAVLLPLASLLVLVLMAGPVLWNLFQKRWGEARVWVLLGLFGLAFPLFVYGLTYLQSGMVDFTMRSLDRLMDPEAFSQWMSPAAVAIQRAANLADGMVSLPGSLLSGLLAAGGKIVSGPNPLSLSPGFWPGWGVIFPTVLVLGLAVSGLTARAAGRFSGGRDDPKPGSGGKGYLVLAGLLLGATLGAYLLVGHEALDRFTGYRSFLLLWLLVWALAALGRAPLGGLYQKLAPAVLMALILALLLPAANEKAGRELSPWRLSFLSGGLSFAQAYDNQWPVRDCLGLAGELPPGARAVALNFTPGCYNLPGFIFQRPLQNAYGRELYRVLYAPPQEAGEALLRSGVRFAVLRRDSSDKLLYTILAPLFRPQAVKTNWRVVELKNPALPYLVLTLDPELGQPPDEDFMAEYSRILATVPIHQEEAFSAGQDYPIGPAQ